MDPNVSRSGYSKVDQTQKTQNRQSIGELVQGAKDSLREKADVQMSKCSFEGVEKTAIKLNETPKANVGTKAVLSLKFAFRTAVATQLINNPFGKNTQTPTTPSTTTSTTSQSSHSTSAAQQSTAKPAEGLSKSDLNAIAKGEDKAISNLTLAQIKELNKNDEAMSKITKWQLMSCSEDQIKALKMDKLANEELEKFLGVGHLDGKVSMSYLSPEQKETIWKKRGADLTADTLLNLQESLEKDEARSKANEGTGQAHPEEAAILDESKPDSPKLDVQINQDVKSEMTKPLPLPKQEEPNQELLFKKHPTKEKVTITPKGAPELSASTSKISPETAKLLRGVDDLLKEIEEMRFTNEQASVNQAVTKEAASESSLKANKPAQQAEEEHLAPTDSKVPGKSDILPNALKQSADSLESKPAADSLESKSAKEKEKRSSWRSSFINPFSSKKTESSTSKAATETSPTLTTDEVKNQLDQLITRLKKPISEKDPTIKVPLSKDEIKSAIRLFEQAVVLGVTETGATKVNTVTAIDRFINRPEVGKYFDKNEDIQNNFVQIQLKSMLPINNIKMIKTFAETLNLITDDEKNKNIKFLMNSVVKGNEKILNQQLEDKKITKEVFDDKMSKLNKIETDNGLLMDSSKIFDIGPRILHHMNDFQKMLDDPIAVMRTGFELGKGKTTVAEGNRRVGNPDSMDRGYIIEDYNPVLVNYIIKPLGALHAETVASPIKKICTQFIEQNGTKEKQDELLPQLKKIVDTYKETGDLGPLNEFMGKLPTLV